MHAPCSDLHFLELTDLATRIRAREVSPVAVTRAQLDRIAALDGGLGSYAHVMAESALAQARAAEAEIAAGRYRGPLHGVPIGVKDLAWTKGIPTAAGMAIHRDHRPAEDATVLLGKPQLTEGAYSDHHPQVMPPKNPWNADYWPGISSSGAAVATAAGLCYAAVASDTGGSIRWPSAAHGLTGLKPSWGRVSRHDVFELAASLDHVGTIARSTVDAAAMLDVMAGADCLASAGDGVRALRIGVDAAWNSDGVDATVQAVLAAAVALFRTLGADIVEVEFPDVTQAITDWSPLCAVEAAVAHQATFPARKGDYGAVLASVIKPDHEG